MVHPSWVIWGECTKECIDYNMGGVHENHQGPAVPWASIPWPQGGWGGEFTRRRKILQERVDCEEGALGQSCEFSFGGMLALRAPTWPDWTTSPRIPSLEVCGQGGPWRDSCGIWGVTWSPSVARSFCPHSSTGFPPWPGGRPSLPQSPFLGSCFSFSSSGPGMSSARWWSSAWRLQSPQSEEQEQTQASVQLRGPQLILVGSSLSWRPPAPLHTPIPSWWSALRTPSSSLWHRNSSCIETA